MKAMTKIFRRLQHTLFQMLLAATIGVFGLESAWGVQDAEVVKLHSGKISGEVLDATVGLQVFRGIPFAEPPVGELRWRPPQDIAPWGGVKVCTEFGPVCPQSPGLTGLVGDPLPKTSEDCLYLNVWTTKAGTDVRQPVMVWIHGGGFNVGWSDQTVYEGSELAKRGVVLVSINYRLGPLGFLAHPALSAESERNVSGNYGLLDTVAALNWVKMNIAAFGGDANNVTIFGESAGGTIVDALCVSPLTEGLIHRGIAQSPGITDGTYAKLKEDTKNSASAEGIGERWASRVLDGETDNALERLRDIPADDLLGTGLSAKIVVDGWFMPHFSEQLFGAGRQHDIPIIVGTNADEGTIFVNRYPYRTVADYQNGMKRQFGDDADKVMALYPVSEDSDISDAINKFISDTWFLRGGTSMLRGMDAVSSNAYQYVFTQKSKRVPERGAFHSMEMYYPFNTLHPDEKESENPELAEGIIQYWVQFAKTGDPNVEGLPQWPVYKSESARYLELGEKIKVGSKYRHKELQVLNNLR